MSYSFRIRFNPAPSNTIETEESQLDLPSPGPGISVALRASSPGKTLKDAERWVLKGEGYKSEADASEAGVRMQDVLILALARLRFGADFGYRVPKGVITKYGLEHFGSQVEARVLNDVHGLSVYQSDPQPRFMEFSARGRVGKSFERFRHVLTEAMALRRSLTERERVSSHLFGASLFQPTADGRFLLLVMAMEALIEPAPKSKPAVAYVDGFIKQIDASPLEEQERNSLIGSLRWLRDKSINQAGRRLATARLGDRMYDNKSAPAFFSYAYGLRSRLVHGDPPEFQEVSHAVAPLEQFVADLLTVPLMEPAGEQPVR